MNLNLTLEIQINKALKRHKKNAIPENLLGGKTAKSRKALINYATSQGLKVTTTKSSKSGFRFSNAKSKTTTKSKKSTNKSSYKRKYTDEQLHEFRIQQGKKLAALNKARKEASGSGTVSSGGLCKEVANIAELIMQLPETYTQYVKGGLYDQTNVGSFWTAIADTFVKEGSKDGKLNDFDIMVINNYDWFLMVIKQIQDAFLDPSDGLSKILEGKDAIVAKLSGYISDTDKSTMQEAYNKANEQFIEEPKTYDDEDDFMEVSGDYKDIFDYFD